MLDHRVYIKALRSFEAITQRPCISLERLAIEWAAVAVLEFVRAARPCYHAGGCGQCDRCDRVSELTQLIGEP